MRSTAEIRKMFLNFFKTKGHTIVPSSSLVPHDDPTLLFTNAGMNQFKEVFLGKETREYLRATTSQRCVRAGGKHNDLDNVGYTARHHTFFEMLGNFSFGDYFKREAIHFAWELLTSKEWFNLPQEKLLVTVYHTDDEAYQIWADEIGLPKDKIIRIGDKKGEKFSSDNFWQMGDTGPCGPCSEIFYDHGEHIFGGPPGSADEDGDRFIEIWNLVFMQFNRQQNGEMLPLPKPSVDTGMGLERIAAVLQHVNSNYDIDLFRSLIQSIAKLLAVQDLNNQSLKVIADHIRACSFLIADGVLPSNEGRGYVLRRIIRRAVRHGNMLGAKEPFFYKLVQPLIDVMADAGKTVAEKQNLVEETLNSEEIQFSKTLERGLTLLENEILQLKGAILPGDIAFKLYDTYGFPFDLTADVCREHSVTVDELGFQEAMAQQRSRSRDKDQFKVDYSQSLDIKDKTEFLGYDINSTEAILIAIYENGQLKTELKSDLPEQIIFILDKTPFYAESGGQVADKGMIAFGESRFEVEDCQKIGTAFAHIGRLVEGSFHQGMKVTATIDEALRMQIKANHSATHLLQASLKKVLGTHIEQKGSLVNDSYLRFDFSHTKAISIEQLQEVENLVNSEIRKNHAVTAEIMPIEEAKEKGAMALFGEKYGNEVRVLSMSDFSMELCGGTHVQRTGDIGYFRILSEASVAAGVRRIEATTGQNALTITHNEQQILRDFAQSLKSDIASLPEKMTQFQVHQKAQEKTIADLKQKMALSITASLVHQVEKTGQINILVAEVGEVDGKLLREIIDDLKNRFSDLVVVLASVIDSKISLAVGVSKSLTGQFKAGEIVADLALSLGGKGGGRPDFAQAGAKEVEHLSDVLSIKKIQLKKSVA